MRRAEFLSILREQLSGKMHEGRIAAHLRYYEDYIQSRVRKGETEESVITSLGNPRLIAKTLLDTDPSGTAADDETDHYKSYADEYGVHEDPSRRSERGGSKVFRIRTLPGKIAAAVVLVLFLSFLFRLAVRILPFILIILLIWFLAGKIRR